VSIPLTFDWLTLAWLELRLGLWWQGRRGSVPRFSPRQLALALLLGVLSGCVPVTRFEEVQSAAQVEMAGRHRAEYRIEQLEAENAQLIAGERQKTAALDEQNDALAQAELDKTTQGKERADAEGIVEQLRGELARVAGHLHSYHAEKQKLEASLEAEAARGRALSRLTRDVSLALAEPLTTGEYTLDAEQQHVLLRVARAKILADDGTVRPEAEALLKTVARLLQLHPESKLRVTDTSAPADPIAASRLLAALGQLSVPADRFEPPAVAEAPATPAPAGTPEIVLGFSVP
jgi:hypothetical protein